LECYENKNAKCMNVIIRRDVSVPRSYEKFTYDLKINYLNSHKESIIEKASKLLHDHDKFIVADNFIDDHFMEFRFEIKLQEYDLTGAEIKSMNSIEYKMNILKDTELLFMNGVGSDDEIEGFKVHNAIMARSPDIQEVTKGIDQDFDAELLKNYLAFVYTGEFMYDLEKEELESLKIFAEKVKFDSLKNVCENMLMNMN
jgi:hypothetical protein